MWNEIIFLVSSNTACKHRGHAAILLMSNSLLKPFSTAWFGKGSKIKCVLKPVIFGIELSSCCRAPPRTLEFCASSISLLPSLWHASYTEFGLSCKRSDDNFFQIWSYGIEIQWFAWAHTNPQIYLEHQTKQQRKCVDKKRRRWLLQIVRIFVRNQLYKSYNDLLKDTFI